MDKIEERKITCPQCGANDFDPFEKNKVKCTHCGTVVDLTLDLSDDITDHLEIKDGGDVKITNGSKVYIKGGLTISGGSLIISGGSLLIGGSDEPDKKEEENKGSKEDNKE